MGDIASRFVRALSGAEREDLERLLREHPRTLGGRAAAVLLSAQGLSIPEIIRRLGVSRPTVASWLTRFEAAGISGLLPRSPNG